MQPAIERGNIQNNVPVIQRLIHNADGDLLILAEYVLTGSLVFDKTADIQRWIMESDSAKRMLSIPENKKLLINSLISNEGRIYNACVLLPENKIVQVKTIPDRTETDAGICAGVGHSVVQLNGKKIVIVICSDIVGINNISTEEADVMLFIYHFTQENYSRHITNLMAISKERDIPIIAASLSSDKNYGHSCYICGSTVVALGNHEGIMEVIL